MKVQPVIEKKVYEAVTGVITDKKRQAEKINRFEARKDAIQTLLVKHFELKQVSEFDVEDFTCFFAEYGDEVIEALTEES